MRYIAIKTIGSEPQELQLTQIWNPHWNVTFMIAKLKAQMAEVFQLLQMIRQSASNKRIKFEIQQLELVQNANFIGYPSIQMVVCCMYKQGDGIRTLADVFDAFS